MKRFICLFLFFISCNLEDNSSPGGSGFSSLKNVPGSSFSDDLQPEDIKRSLAEAPEITPNFLKNYIAFYKISLQKFPELLDSLNTGNINYVKTHKQYNSFKNLLQQNGFTLKNFDLINRKIYTLHTFAEGERQIGMGTGVEALEFSMENFRKILNDPNASEEMKKSARESMKEYEKAKRKYELVMADKKWQEKVRKARRRYRDELIKEVCNISEYDLIKSRRKDLTSLYLRSENPKLIYIP